MVLQDLSKVCKTSHKNTVMHIVENIATYANKQKRRQFICRRTLSGVSEIRTRDTLLTYTRFPGIVKNLQILMAESDANADF